MGMQKTVATLVAEAKSRIENLSIEQVEKELTDGKTLLVDIREADERRAKGAIPGSIHAPRGMLEFYADPESKYHRPEFEPGRRIILHCAAGGRSALAAAVLKEMGHNVAHLEGGFEAWSQSGCQVVPDSPS